MNGIEILMLVQLWGKLMVMLGKRPNPIPSLAPPNPPPKPLIELLPLDLPLEGLIA